MRSSLSTLATAAALVLAGGCASLNPFADDEPKAAALPQIQPTAELREVWEVRIGAAGPYVFQPAVVGEDVYAAAHDGSVARYVKGQASWSVKVGTRLSAGVGSDGRLAVVVGSNGEVVALDAATGAERWRAPSGAEIIASPAVGESVVVVRASDSRLIAFDAKDGSQRWVYQRATPPLALRSFAGMSLQDNAVVVGYPGGKLVAVNLANGGALWELSVATPRGATELERVADVAGTPVFGRREVCAVTFQGRAACFDLGNGNTLWAREFSSSVGMTRDARHVYITDENDAVHALDATSGAAVWKQEALARRGVTRPVVVGDYVAVGDRDGYVHLLRRDTGEFAARTRAESSAISAEPLADGRGGLVVQASGGGLYAFEIR